MSGYPHNRGGGYAQRGMSPRGRGGRGTTPTAHNPSAVYTPDHPCVPNTKVTELENQVVKLDLIKSISKLALNTEPIRRPEYGTQGKRVNLWTNYFNLAFIGKYDLYKYTVTFHDENISKRSKRRFIQALLQEQVFQGANAATDFSQIIITTRKIKLQLETGRFKIKLATSEVYQPQPAAVLHSSSGPQQRRPRSLETTLTVQFDSTLSVQELLKSLGSTQNYYPLREETIQALNIIMAKFAQNHPRIISAGKGRFFPFDGPYSDSTSLEAGLQAFRGSFASVRTSVGRVLLNLNVSTAAFYKDGPLTEVVREFKQAGNSPKSLDRFLRRLRVSTNYTKARDSDGREIRDSSGKAQYLKLYKTIKGLATRPRLGASANEVTFEWEDPSQPNSRRTMTVADYFRSKLGVALQRPFDEVVNLGSEAQPAWVPMELCTIEKGQPARMVLSGNQTRNMISHALRSPCANARDIVHNGLHTMGVLPQDAAGTTRWLGTYGLNVEPKMLSVQGRILEAPTLQYQHSGNPGKLHEIRPHIPGKWNLVGLRFYRPKELQGCGCLVISDDDRGWNEGKLPAVAAMNAFSQVLRGHGIRIVGEVMYQGLRLPNKPMLRGSDNAEARKTYQVRIEEWYKEVKSEIGLKMKKMTACSFILVLLPSTDAYVYDQIKRIGDLEMGVITQCCQRKPFMKSDGQYLSNVAMKVNLKLGGVNHHVKLQELPNTDKNTIIMGIDVTHPSPGSKDNAPSIAASVASIDENFAQYRPDIRVQTARQEMVNELGDMIRRHLQHWSKVNNNRIPTKVIVFRDGVSEGQYETVLNEEYPQFVKAFRDLYGNAPHPKVTIIVCGKRHHTRFYPSDSREQQRNNLIPGTVVDRGITGEKTFDFYMCAHEGIMGTSRPAHYVVLKDDNRFSADMLQRLIHNLCYTFGRATRSVSLCPPAYYADILCERGRSYLHEIMKGGVDAASSGGSQAAEAPVIRIHDRLEGRMFYI